MQTIKEDLFEIISKKKGEKYDVAVMYSGGKDSSYLLYLLKEVYKLRVIAVSVNNGYEDDFMSESMIRFAANLNIPIQVIEPNKEYFRIFYKMTILEYELFMRPHVNHVCFLCNSLLWANVMKFAYENKIPMVASGLDLAQMNSGRSIPLETNKIANSIAEKSTRLIFANAVQSMKKSKIYESDLEFQKFIDTLKQSSHHITTIYPYIYHEYSLTYLKEELRKLGWAPPGNTDRTTYISSGCRIIFEVLSELEKLGLLTLNEKEQAKWMVQKGLMDRDIIMDSQGADAVDLRSELMEELEIKSFLIEQCKKKNVQYYCLNETINY